jgi:hypothetical protein
VEVEPLVPPEPGLDLGALVGRMAVDEQVKITPIAVNFA